MRTNIKAKNIELTEAIKAYIHKKMNMLDRVAHHHGKTEDAVAYVEIEKLTGSHHRKGRVFRAEVQVDLKSHLLRVEKSTSDLYKAIDKVKDEMERQLVRIKDKELTKRKRG